ncbi:MAG TPA: TIGR03435 family protein [Bryobacteraceae bacterium]|jgi:uncharacterized protein (TIGR03435 family)
MKNVAGMGAAVLLAAMAVSGQTDTAARVFEVASIKPGKPILQAITDGSFIGMAIEPGRVRIGQMPLSKLIQTAYGIRKYQLAGPDWLLNPQGPSGFDIEAKLPPGATADEVPAMLQTLLRDRFHLVAHAAGGEMDTYALVVAKGGVKFQRKDPTGGPKGMAAGTGTFKMSIVPGAGTHVETSTITGLVDYLSPEGTLPLPVVDKTGLTDEFDIKMDIPPAGITPGAPIDLAALREASMTRLFEAVEKLGLKLERQKNRVETIVVDRVDKTPTEN